jgi:hypothetical protein
MPLKSRLYSRHLIILFFRFNGREKTYQLESSPPVEASTIVGPTAPNEVAATLHVGCDTEAEAQIGCEKGSAVFPGSRTNAPMNETEVTKTTYN